MKTLSELGERKAIKLISQIITKGDFSVDLGDDCAAIDYDDNYILVTTDMISQKTHIPKEMSPYQIGWFLVAINLSDIAAKGGKPLGIVLSYGLPKKTSKSFLIEMTKGADACATNYNTFIIGGDTKETNDVTLCGTALGIVKKDEFMPRRGVLIDDIVAVSGPLGKAAAGFLYLNNKNLPDAISKYLFEPEPRLKEGELLSKQKCVTSCMDLSDGLSSSLYQLSDLNDLGFEIYKKDIPIFKELFYIKGENCKEINYFDYAVHFGGDYELLLTIPKKFFNKTKHKLESIGSNLYAIGRVVKNKKIILIRDNDKVIIENKGYEHFRDHSF